MLCDVYPGVVTCRVCLELPEVDATTAGKGLSLKIPATEVVAEPSVAEVIGVVPHSDVKEQAST